MRAALLLTALALLITASGKVRARAVLAEPEAHERADVENVVRRAWEALPVKNSKPLIGILTQPCNDCPGRSYISAGFVKWIELAGGRPVPIRFYASDAELYRLFKSINGLVFPGGLTWLWLDAPYVITARKLFNWAVKENAKGNPFPIHGTCLGFQLLHILASNVSRNDLLVETDSVAHASTLEFLPGAESSYMFGSMSTELRAKLSNPTQNIALENHEYGLPPSNYDRWPILKQWYKQLTTSKDRNGTVYLSTMEGVKYPFFGTQWHPEKPPFEFGMEEVPHSLDSILVSQHIANTFIEAARRSSHKPESHEEELALLIYDTPPIFSARFEVMAADNYDGPDMTYYFDQKDKPPSGPDDAPGPSNRAYWAARASRAKANPNAKRVGDDGLPMHAARTGEWPADMIEHSNGNRARADLDSF